MEYFLSGRRAAISETILPRAIEIKTFTMLINLRSVHVELISSAAKCFHKNAALETPIRDFY